VSEALTSHNGGIGIGGGFPEMEFDDNRRSVWGSPPLLFGGDKWEVEQLGAGPSLGFTLPLVLLIRALHAFFDCFLDILFSNAKFEVSNTVL
jgi:hypothetical protein